MAFWKIYAGLGGGFGGGTYQETIEAETRELALQYAEETARDEYWSYEGCYGLGPEEDEEWSDEDYEDDMSSWLDYWVKPATSLEDEE